MRVGHRHQHFFVYTFTVSVMVDGSRKTLVCIYQTAQRYVSENSRLVLLNSFTPIAKVRSNSKRHKDRLQSVSVNRDGVFYILWLYFCSALGGSCIGCSVLFCLFSPILSSPYLPNQTKPKISYTPLILFLKLTAASRFPNHHTPFPKKLTTKYSLLYLQTVASYRVD
jgi:hypothetical protein